MSRLEKAILAAGTPLESDGETFTKTFVLDADFIGFDGHFPDTPILPAMVQLMIGHLTASEAAGRELQVTDASRAKFLKPVEPGDRITVTGKLTAKEDVTKANVTLTVDEEIASTYHLTLVSSEK